MPGYGPKNASIMVVGEAYGAMEEKVGRPFVGPAGNLLRELLLKAGIQPEEVYFTNLCNKRPPGNDLSLWYNKGDLDDTFIDGLLELQEEIQEVNPNVIVPVGNYPLWAFYRSTPSGISDYRGYVLEAKKLAPGRKIVPTYHPSYLLRGNYRDSPIALFDLRKARKESAFPDVRRKTRKLILDPQGAEREIVRDQLLRDGPFLTADIEYIGSKLVCIGFAVSPDWAASIAINSREDLEFCRELLESGRPLNMQNGMSDCAILEWFYDFDVVRHLKHDTMVGAYVINIEYQKDLGFLGSLYTDLPYWKDMVSWPAVRKGEQSIDDVLAYNCFDNLCTHEVAEKQAVEIAKDPAYQWAFDFDMKKLLPLWECSKRGVRIDVEAMEALKKRLSLEAGEMELVLGEINGSMINTRSPKQVGAFLFEQLGIPHGGKTPTGGYRTDDKTLADRLSFCTDGLQKKSLQLIRDTRERLNTISKFCEIELEDDNRIRCHYDPTKTSTRRLSSRKFGPTGRGANLQNIHRDKAVRSVFIPDEGMGFGYADLKGAEFLVVASLCHDHEMARLAQMTIDGTGDVHKETAAFIFNKPFSEITTDERYIGKTTRHSANYMVGWKTFMLRVNADGDKTGVYINAAQSKRIIAAYRDMHPGLVEWWRETERIVKSTHTLYNLCGAKRIFHGRLDAELPEIIAFVPQSTVGDLLNIVLLKCGEDDELKELGYQLLLQVHDAIGYQYPLENEFAVNSRIRQLMTHTLYVQRTERELTIPVEIQVGPSWGEVKLWEQDLKATAA